jgi:hypothetical protein
MSVSRLYSRFLPALMLVLILAAAAFAFAAANVVPVTGAGDGANTISGYTVGAIHYNLAAADPTTISSVQFTLTPITLGAGVPADVQVQINGGGSWYTCSLAAPTWTCPLGISVLSATNLRVVAAQ